MDTYSVTVSSTKGNVIIPLRSCRKRSSDPQSYTYCYYYFFAAVKGPVIEGCINCYLARVFPSRLKTTVLWATTYLLAFDTDNV